MLARWIESMSHDWALKATALALAFLLWAAVRAESPYQHALDVPVRVENDDPNWSLSGMPSPPTVTVTFRGPARELLRLSNERIQVVVPIEQVQDSTEIHTLGRNLVRGANAEGTVVEQIVPGTVRLSFDRVATRLLPVAVRTEGSLPAGFQLEPLLLEPPAVRAMGAARTLAGIDSLRLPTIDLRERRGTDTVDLTIDTTGTGLIVSPRTIRVIVPVRPALSDTTTVPFGAQGGRGRGG